VELRGSFPGDSSIEFPFESAGLLSTFIAMRDKSVGVTFLPVVCLLFPGVSGLLRFGPLQKTPPTKLEYNLIP